MKILSFHSNICILLIDLTFCTLICLGLSTEATLLVQYLLGEVCIVNFTPLNAVCHVYLLVCEAVNCSVCCNFTIFTQMQDEVFYLNLALQYVRSS